jgi:hypothetical protein
MEIIISTNTIDRTIKKPGSSYLPGYNNQINVRR